MLDACAWRNSRAHRVEIAEALVSPDLLDVRKLIEARLTPVDGPRAVRFFDDGAVNYPRASDSMWFVTQYPRWGMLDVDIDAVDVAAAVNQTAPYREAAQAAGIAVPDEHRAATFCDGRVWDGTDTAEERDLLPLFLYLPQRTRARRHDLAVDAGTHVHRRRTGAQSRRGHVDPARLQRQKLAVPSRRRSPRGDSARRCARGSAARGASRSRWAM